MPKIINSEKALDNKKFNDKDLLYDIAYNDKYLSSVYSNLIGELSNKYLKDKFSILHNCITKEECETLNFLFKNGWIGFNTALENDINEALNEAKKFLEEL